MQPQGGFTGGLSPDAVKTAIDGVAWEHFTRKENPQYLTATDDFFFKQGSTVGNAFIWDESSNVGIFQKTGEQEEILNTDAFIGNQKTKVSQKYTKQVPISDEAFRADMASVRANIGQMIGDRARVSQDQFGIQDTYADAFAGAVNTTPDGQALASNSHLTLKGITVDNLETGSLTPDNLWTVTNALASQKAQDGDLGSHLFEGMLVPFVLYKTAKEVMNSQLVANSGENNINVFDTDYGEVRIKASVYLNSASSGATNANTSYHVLGRNHQIMRKTFYGLTTTLLSPENTANDSYILRYKFHETTFPGSWTAYVGSNGTA